MSDERMRALEKLLVILMKGEQYSAGRQLSVGVAADNQATVEFTLPPTKSDIDALIAHLQLMRKNRPEDRASVSMDAINAALDERGIAPLT